MKDSWFRAVQLRRALLIVAAVLICILMVLMVRLLDVLELLQGLG